MSQHEDTITEELVLPLISCVVPWVKERSHPPLSRPHDYEGRRAAAPHQLQNSVEKALHLTWADSRVALDLGIMGELALRA